MTSKEQIDEIKRLIVTASRMLYAPNGITEEPLEFSQGGHVSIRHPDGDRFFVVEYIRGDGRTFLNDLTPDDLLTVALDGKPVETGRRPVGEVVIHSAIYKARPDVNSVIHVHPFWATTLSIAGKSLQCVGTTWGGHFPNGVPMFDTGFGWLVTDEHGERTVEALGSGAAVVHKGHGIVVAESSVYDAVETTVAVECLAKQQAYASLLGSPQAYTLADIEAYYREAGGKMWARTSQKRWLWYVRRLQEKGLLP